MDEERVRALMEQLRELRERADSLAQMQAQIAAQLEEAMSLAADLRKKRAADNKGDFG
jgi:prefoldin subunit 5